MDKAQIEIWITIVIVIVVTVLFLLFYTKAGEGIREAISSTKWLPW